MKDTNSLLTEMQCSSYSKYVIILASGAGCRMNNNLPKQYLLLNDKPIIFHTAERIHAFNPDYQLILVINKEHDVLFNELKEKYHFTVPLQIVYGGSERFYSVQNALNTIQDNNSLVAIHDGVRPFATKNMFENNFATAEQYGAAICAIKPTDSIRIEKNNTAVTTDRNNILLIQTPQTFKTSLIKKVYQSEYRKEITDDASLLAKVLDKNCITEGSRDNIKITYPIDLQLAEIIMKNECEKRKY